MINNDFLNIQKEMPKSFFEFEREISSLKFDKPSLLKFFDKFFDKFLTLDKEFGFCEHVDYDYIKYQLNKQFDYLNRPLAFIPIGVKDTFNTRHLPTTMGSELWKGFKAGNNARIVDELEDRGALTFCKTTSAEFAVHFISPGKTINPWNSEHITGTSSSGSAVGVAIGAFPLALGTQTAGSIIRPASFVGVYGFKPSFGAIDRTGVLKTNDLFDTIGFLGSDLYGLSKTFSNVLQATKDYPKSSNYFTDFNAFKSRKKIRLGVFTDQFKGFSQYESYVVDQFKEFINLISGEYEISNVDNVEFINEIHPIHEISYTKSLSYYFEQESQRINKVSPIMKKMMEEGKRISLEDYKKVNENKVDLENRFKVVWEKYDFILTPSTASVAPKLGISETPDTCLIWTFFGYPVINLPMFFNLEKNLPFGLQIVANRYSDFSLLDFASRLNDKFDISLGSFLNHD